MKIVDVVAALIWKDGRFLICQRPAHKARGMLWEFVGGKVEEGESREAALIRECNEELGVDIAVYDLFMELDHIYPDISIHLSLYHCKVARGEMQALEHNALQWITPNEIANYAFCPADKEILKQIQLQYG